MKPEVIERQGYQPNKGTLNPSKPPRGGTGVPPKTMKLLLATVLFFCSVEAQTVKSYNTLDTCSGDWQALYFPNTGGSYTLSVQAKTQTGDIRICTAGDDTSASVGGQIQLGVFDAGGDGWKVGDSLTVDDGDSNAVLVVTSTSDSAITGFKYAGRGSSYAVAETIAVVRKGAGTGRDATFMVISIANSPQGGFGLPYAGVGATPSVTIPNIPNAYGIVWVKGNANDIIYILKF